jgi:hypothetical protein
MLRLILLERLGLVLLARLRVLGNRAIIIGSRVSLRSKVSLIKSVYNSWINAFPRPSYCLVMRRLVIG